MITVLSLVRRLVRSLTLVAGLIGISTGLLPSSAHAHATSTGLATLDLRETSMQFSLSLPLGELDPPARDTLAQAAAGDTAAASQVGQWLRTQIVLTQGGQACQWRRIRLQTAPADTARLVLLAQANCPLGAPNAVLRDDLSQVLGEHYRSIVSVTDGAGVRSEHVLDRAHPEVAVISGQKPQAWALFWLGMAHIGSGLDHLLFVFVLVLGAIAAVPQDASRGMNNPSPLWPDAVAVARPIALLVTAFTVAHSASLAMATLQWVQLPNAVVEPLIAASIVWVAVSAWRALRARTRRLGVNWRELPIVFAFGLVHGWAFSEALTPLQLSGTALLWALLSFNLGVEAAQLLVVAVCVPVLLALRRHAAAARALPWAAGAAAAVGVFWLVERLIQI